jgi:multidrug resistance efflux pump
MSKVTAESARLESSTFTVGIGYSGIIERQRVEEGDVIKAGDVLFEFRSPTLSEAVKNKELADDQLLYAMTDTGAIEITAAADGTMQEISYRAGAFVPANNEIAIVNADSALYVTATFKLTPPSYAKLKNGNRVSVLLPDNTRLDGTAYGIELDSSGEEIYTTLKVRIDQAGINRDVFSAGTPVEATLYLDTTTWYNRIRTFVREL